MKHWCLYRENEIFFINLELIRLFFKEKNMDYMMPNLIQHIMPLRLAVFRFNFFDRNKPGFSFKEILRQLEGD